MLFYFIWINGLTNSAGNLKVAVLIRFQNDDEAAEVMAYLSSNLTSWEFSLNLAQNPIATTTNSPTTGQSVAVASSTDVAAVPDCSAAMGFTLQNGVCVCNSAMGYTAQGMGCVCDSSQGYMAATGACVMPSSSSSTGSSTDSSPATKVSGFFAAMISVVLTLSLIVTL